MIREPKERWNVRLGRAFNRLEKPSEALYKWFYRKGAPKTVVPMLVGSLIAAAIVFLVAAVFNLLLKDTGVGAKDWNDVAAWVSVILGTPVALGGSIVAILLADRAVESSERTNKLEQLQFKTELLDPLQKRVGAISQPIADITTTLDRIEHATFGLVVAYTQLLPEIYHVPDDTHLVVMNSLAHIRSSRRYPAYEIANQELATALDQFSKDLDSSARSRIVQDIWRDLVESGRSETFPRLVERGVAWPGQRLALQHVVAHLAGSNSPEHSLLILDKTFRPVIKKYCIPGANPYDGQVEPWAMLHVRRAAAEILQRAEGTALRRVAGEILWSAPESRLEAKALAEYNEKEWAAYEAERDRLESEYQNSIEAWIGEDLQDDKEPDGYQEPSEEAVRNDPGAAYAKRPVDNLGTALLADVRRLKLSKADVSAELEKWLRSILGDSTLDQVTDDKSRHKSDATITTSLINLALSVAPDSVFDDERNDAGNTVSAE
jgi:hypothetical protein